MISGEAIHSLPAPAVVAIPSVVSGSGVGAAAPPPPPPPPLSPLPPPPVISEARISSSLLGAAAVPGH